MTTLVVFVEQAAGTARRAALECVSAAKSTGAEVVAVLTGPSADAAAVATGPAGASKAIVLTGADAFSPDRTAADLAKLVTELGAVGFLAAASSAGKDIAPRVAAHLDCTLFTDCVALSDQGGKLEVQRPWCAGKVLATLQSKSAVFCATTRPNAFPLGESGGAVAVESRPASAETKVVVESVAEKPSGKLDVKEAPVVVSGGRGLKDPANFKLIEDLAAAFGDAAVGASRAVVDAGWRPHAEQVGQTGKTVSPGLYIAVGISGAIQHLAGMRTSKVIVAINKDAEAPIFKVADYGIVGDALEILPVLTAAVAKVKSQA